MRESESHGETWSAFLIVSAEETRARYRRCGGWALGCTSANLAWRRPVAGSRFPVTQVPAHASPLPCHCRRSARMAKKVRSGITTSCKTVLVVDDEPHMVEFIAMNLELEGLRVIKAANGYEALEKAVKDMPDLVVLDIMMPDMDGFETLEKLREDFSVPVIFLSAKGEEVARIRGLDLGADDYIAKPFSPRELVSRIRAVLRRTEAAASASASEIVVDDELR